MDIAVSVIIPVFNRENCIERCIRSICAQTLKNIEIIAVDDGSVDGTLSVLKNINDERLKIVSQKNMGQGFARNKGISMASGEYVAFVDSDDTIDPDMLEKMYTAAKTENADMVQCNIRDIYTDGSERIQLSYKDAVVNVKDRGRYMDKYFSTCRHSFEVCNKLINLSFLMETGVVFRDTKKYFSEDLMFNIELINHLKKICFISLPYYNYYLHEDSHLHSNNAVRLAAICDLFMEYTSKADADMRSAVSYTAAMVILYNVGLCTSEYTDIAMQVLKSSVMKKYIRAALGRRCRLKHRIFLLAMRIMPVGARLELAEEYSKR